MRHAPAVRVPCVAGALWRYLPMALHCLTAAAMVLWCLRMLGATPLWSGLAAGTVAAAVAVWFARALKPTPTILQWDGTSWSLLGRDTEQPIALSRVDVMMDLGAWLLLRTLDAERGVRWLPVHRRDAPADFRALCRAAYAHASAAERGVLGTELPR